MIVDVSNNVAKCSFECILACFSFFFCRCSFAVYGRGKHGGFITQVLSPRSYQNPRLCSAFSEDHLSHSEICAISVIHCKQLLYAIKLHQGVWTCGRVINLDSTASIRCRASTPVSLNLPPEFLKNRQPFSIPSVRIQVPHWFSSPAMQGQKIWLESREP